MSTIGVAFSIPTTAVAEVVTADSLSGPTGGSSCFSKTVQQRSECGSDKEREDLVYSCLMLGNICLSILGQCQMIILFFSPLL